MRAYGKKKISTPIACHSECGICHGPQKNLKGRARREGKQEAQEHNQDAAERKPDALETTIKGDSDGNL